MTVLCWKPSRNYRIPVAMLWFPPDITVETSAVTDADGLSAAAWACQWLAEGSEIATASATC